MISFDQGSEHRGQFGRAVKAMGIDVIKRMPNAPKGGSPVERLIQTIETEVLTDMPGYSPRQEPIDPYAVKESEGSRRLSALKYEPYRMEIPVSALCTLGDVTARIAGWGASYNARPHVGLALEPFQVRRLVDEAHREASGDRVRGEMPWPHVPSVIPALNGDADNSPEQEEDAA